MRFALLALVACGSSTRAPAHVDQPKPVARPTPVVAPQTASDAQCKQLIAHALELGVAEDGGAAMPPDSQAALRTKLEADYGPPCRALGVDEVSCGIAAKTLADMEQCQRSESSSTSNRSVELPGMSPPPTPAAP